MPQRATALLRIYLGNRVGCVDKAESKSCRAMLRSLNEVQADGNEMGIELAIMKAKGPAVQIYFNIHGVGPVVWLPVLVLQANDNLHQIMRETSPDRVAIDRPRPTASDPDADTSRRRVPPKVQPVLIPGRKF